MATLTPRLESGFGVGVAQRAVEVMALTELASPDCYGDPAPPAHVVDDILTAAEGDLGRLVHAALLAVTDLRDLRVAADGTRARAHRPAATPGPP